MSAHNDGVIVSCNLSTGPCSVRGRGARAPCWPWHDLAMVRRRAAEPGRRGQKWRRAGASKFGMVLGSAIAGCCEIGLGDQLGGPPRVATEAILVPAPVTVVPAEFPPPSFSGHSSDQTPQPPPRPEHPPPGAMHGRSEFLAARCAGFTVVYRKWHLRAPILTEMQPAWCVAGCHPWLGCGWGDLVSHRDGNALHRGGGHTCVAAQDFLDRGLGRPLPCCSMNSPPVIAEIQPPHSNRPSRSFRCRAEAATGYSNVVRNGARAPRWP